MPIDKPSGLVLALFFLRFFDCLFFFHGFSGFFLAFFFGVLVFGHDLSSRVEKIEFYLYRGIKLKPYGLGFFTPVGRYVSTVYLCKMSFPAKHLLIGLLWRLTRLIKYGNYSFFTNCRYAVINTNQTIVFDRDQ